MAQRTVRVNELLQREVSDVLHTQWRDESVRITITACDISPDLRNLIVFYSVIGTDDDKRAARKLINKASKGIRAEVGRRVTLKYNPEYKFMYDDSGARGVSLIDTLDKVAETDRARERRHPQNDD